VSAIAIVEREDNPKVENQDETGTNLHRQSEELLHTAVNFARSRGVLLTPILREGRPANTIIACAEEEESTLVILGANSKATAGGLGGTADQVARHSSCTVMIVR